MREWLGRYERKLWQCKSTYMNFGTGVLAELYVCERADGHPGPHQDLTRRKAWRDIPPTAKEDQ